MGRETLPAKVLLMGPAGELYVLALDGKIRTAIGSGVKGFDGDGGPPKDAKLDSPIYLQDVMATTLELAGAPKPEQVEFHSVLPLLRAEKSPAAREKSAGERSWFFALLIVPCTVDGEKFVLEISSVFSAASFWLLFRCASFRRSHESS